VEGLAPYRAVEQWIRDSRTPAHVKVSMTLETLSVALNYELRRLREAGSAQEVTTTACSPGTPESTVEILTSAPHLLAAQKPKS